MATYDIDKLQIEIAASSTKAAKNIEKLAKALAELKTAVTGNAQELEKVKKEIDETGNSAEKAAAKQDKMASSSSKTAIKVGVLYATLKKVSTAMAGWITESNEYIENLNLFQVAMGSAAAEAKEYAETVQAALGIDPSEWMQNQAMFKQVTSGFGVAEDAANAMSKQLTQLGYDISSLYNISIEDAMTKLQSGISGEIEPLRRLGFAIDNATIQQVAYNHGITTLVKNMNQAQKSQLRYIAIMEQSTNAQGDLARTVQAPANAIRILRQQVTQLARALGNALLPALQVILPIAQACVEVLTDLAQRLANFFGFELPTIDYSGLDGVTSGAEDAEDALNGATAAAKKLNNTLGIDELNILKEPSSSSSGTSYETDFGIDMSQWDYDFLGNVQKQADDLKESAKEILGYVGSIGIGLAGWKVASGVINTIKSLKSLTSETAAIGIGLVIAGVSLSFSAGYKIGYDGGDADSFKSKIFGELAAGLGGALIGTAIMPGLGTIVGGLIGLSAGIVANLVGLTLGEKQGFIDRFWASEDGKYLADLKGLIEDNLSQSMDLRVHIASLTGEIDENTLATLDTAQRMIDSIFRLDANDNLTAEQAEILKVKIETLNSLGLAGLQLTFDETTGHVKETKEEVQKLIDNLYEQYRVEALRESLIQSYKDEYAAKKQLSDATKLQEQTAKEYIDRQRELSTAQAKLNEVTDYYYGVLRRTGSSAQATLETEQALGVSMKQLREDVKAAEAALAETSGVLDEAAEGVNEANLAVQEAGEKVIFFENEAYNLNTALDNAGTTATNTARKFDSYTTSANTAASAVRGLAAEIAGLSSASSLLGGFESSSSRFSVKAFASGGFPEHGELFMANEAGPELVARIGNRTAVANTDQIVTAVASGVSNATVTQNALLRTQNELLQKILAKTGTVLDGKTLSNSVNRANRERGASIMAGGVTG